jgi:fatty-acyl-CoA synthase
MHLRELCVGYGMTETAPLSFMTPCDDPLERRVGTVGRVMPHVEVKIVDAGGRVVPRGTRGELCTRGYSLMRGYMGSTTPAFDDAGWMHTGDLATLDEDGCACLPARASAARSVTALLAATPSPILPADCNIVGRIKDMIIRGGENVYPAEVEAFLLTHPSILDVQVFGVADKVYGEEVAAWVRLRADAPRRLTADDVRDFCAGRISHEKHPRIVEVVPNFPLTTSGKPQKFLMRKDVEERTGRRAPATA